MNDIVLRNARLVLANETVLGHVLVRDGRIAAVASGPTSLPGAQDLEGDFLLPGLVEMHTDNLERHVMPRPKVTFPMQAAVQAHDGEVAAAGITTVLDAIGVGDPYDDGFRSRDQSDLLHVLDRLDAAGALRADHHIHVRSELPAPNALELFEPFRGHRRLRLISLMDHTPGQRQWTEIEHARVYYTGKKGWTQREVRRGDAHRARAPGDATPSRIANGSPSSRAARGIALATHDDTTVAHVDEAVALGAVMSEFPTSLAAARHARACGLATIAGAPNVVRGGSHSGNVAALALAREGVLDALSSDYVPASLLLAAWILRRDAGFSLSEAVHVVSRAPARACGFDDRGEIANGLRADLVRVREVDGHPVVREVWSLGRRVA